MAELSHSVKNIQNQVEQTARKAAPWVEKMARLGYAAKGIVYIVIGFLAVEAAFTSGGKTTNNQGALVTIADQPFGQFLIAIVGFGLAGYALWRLVEAILDVEHKGHDAKGIVTRIAFFIGGITYGFLAFTAFQLLMGHATSGDSNQKTQDWTARLLAMPFGQGLVGLVGLVILGIGLAQIVKGYKADFGSKLKTGEMSPTQRKWAVVSGRWGYGALGLVFAIIGWFFIEAAMHADPKDAKGVGNALDVLSRQPYGSFVLGIVALGLMAYGVFMLVEARYRDINV